MTFNLRYASASDGIHNWANPSQAPDRRHLALSVIQNHAPDIIGLQEGEDSQLDFLCANLPEYACESSKPSGGNGNENAAMAWRTDRLELLENGVFALSESPGQGYCNNPEGAEFDPYKYFPDVAMEIPRIAMWGRFRWKINGRQFLFYTTHMDFNDQPQARSAQMIVDDATSRLPHTPLAIVVGDFNCSQSSNCWMYFAGAFTDSWLRAHGDWKDSGTFHEYKGGVRKESERLDWILHRGFEAVNAEIIFDSKMIRLQDKTTQIMYPSDHYPVMSTLKFP